TPSNALGDEDALPFHPRLLVAEERSERVRRCVLGCEARGRLRGELVLAAGVRRRAVPGDQSDVHHLIEVPQVDEAAAACVEVPGGKARRLARRRAESLEDAVAARSGDEAPPAHEPGSAAFVCDA